MAFEGTKKMKFNLFMCASGLLFSMAVQAQMPVPLLDKRGGAAPIPKFLTDRGAKVLDVSPGPGGLTVFTAEKDGKPIVLYTSADRTVTFVGVLFDSSTGKNLSDPLVERSLALMKGAGARDGAPSAAPAKSQGSASANAPRGPVAQHLFSDEVAGVTEGKGDAGSTTYVFFDPRCPYCHNLFTNTRDVAKRGAPIKWIPVNTLGAPGVPMSAEVLRKGLPAMEPLAAGSLRGVEPTVLERERIQANTSLFGAIVQQVGKQAATPTIVFQAANGKFSVVQDDGSDKQAFAAAFRIGAP